MDANKEPPHPPPSPAHPSHPVSPIHPTQAELANLLPPNQSPFRDVIVTGPLGEEAAQRCRAVGLRVHRFAELEALGNKELAILEQVPPPGYDDIALLCYTSGTTGDPKGAMLSNGNVLSALAMANHPEFTVFKFSPDSPQEVHLSYLPLAHIFETVIIRERKAFQPSSATTA